MKPGVVDAREGMRTMTQNARRQEGADLVGLLAAQLRQADNRRQIGRIPLFQASNEDTADRFASLLSRLDRAERRSRA